MRKHLSYSTSGDKLFAQSVRLAGLGDGMTGEPGGMRVPFLERERR